MPYLLGKNGIINSIILRYLIFLTLYLQYVLLTRFLEAYFSSLELNNKRRQYPLVYYKILALANHLRETEDKGKKIVLKIMLFIVTKTSFWALKKAQASLYHIMILILTVNITGHFKLTQTYTVLVFLTSFDITNKNLFIKSPRFLHWLEASPN